MDEPLRGPSGGGQASPMHTRPQRPPMGSPKASHVGGGTPKGVVGLSRVLSLGVDG
jgi:hypothetical protein